MKKAWLAKVITSYEEIASLDTPVIHEEFRSYSAEQMRKIWEYAKIGGMRVYEES